LTDGAEVSRGISALVPKCPDSSAPVKIWCRIVSRHFGTILYWCRSVGTSLVSHVTMFRRRNTSVIRTTVRTYPKQYLCR